MARQEISQAKSGNARKVVTIFPQKKPLLPSEAAFMRIGYQIVNVNLHLFSYFHQLVLHEVFRNLDGVGSGSLA